MNLTHQVWPTILDRIKWNSKPPSPPNQGWSPREGQKTRHFPILDFGGGGGGEGGSRFSIYFAQDCSPEKTVCRYFATPLMIFIKKLNHYWIMQFMAKSRTVIRLSLDLLREEISRNNTFNLIYDLSSLSTPFRKWKRKEMKDRKYYKRCYVSTVFSVFSIIFSYTVYTNPKNKTKQTTTQTNKQTNKQTIIVCTISSC